MVETKKPEIIQDCNKIMLGVEGAEQILHYCPCCKITMKWFKKFLFFALQLSSLNSFIFFKNYTTNQIQKCKNWAFRDFIFDLLTRTYLLNGAESFLRS
jgi:hypothetical protein